MSRILLGVLAVAAVSLLTFTACSSDDNGNGKATAEAAGTVTLGGTTFVDHGTKDVKGKDEVELEADSFYFSPTFLHGTPGQKLKIEIENESSALHNFSVTAQGVSQDIPAKGKSEVELTVPASGAVLFFCKYHTGQGMNGELLAGDATPGAVSAAGTSASRGTNGGDYSYP
jgi:plastocyanin